MYPQITADLYTHVLVYRSSFGICTCRSRVILSQVAVYSVHVVLSVLKLTRPCLCPKSLTRRLFAVQPAADPSVLQDLPHTGDSDVFELLN